MHPDGDTLAVILHGTTAVKIDPNRYKVATSRERLVDRVIQHLVNKMVQAALLAIADIHVRPLANRFEALQYLDAARIVSMIRLLGCIGYPYNLLGRRTIFFRPARGHSLCKCPKSSSLKSPNSCI